jgi:hypothetical protein
MWKKKKKKVSTNILSGWYSREYREYWPHTSMVIWWALAAANDPCSNRASCCCCCSSSKLHSCCNPAASSELQNDIDQNVQHDVETSMGNYKQEF